MEDRFNFDVLFNKLLEKNPEEIIALLEMEIKASEPYLGGEQYYKYDISRYHDNCLGIVFFMDNNTKPLMMGRIDFQKYGRLMAQYLVQNQNFPESYLKHFE